MEFFTVYKANKMVAIRSRSLALFSRFVQFSIVGYIVVWVILYQNKHLLPVQMHGSIRLTVQQPTQGCNPMHVHCKSDYMKMSSLPYCTQFQHRHEGNDPVSFVPWSDAMHGNATKLKQYHMQHQCVYQDSINLTFANPVPGTLFLLTRVSELPQHRQCAPTAGNGWECDGSLYQMEHEEAQKNYFIADIERFTLLLDHSFSVTLPNVKKPLRGRGTDYKGRVQHAQTGDLMEIPKKPHSSEYESLFSIPIGTIVSLGDLLRLADASGFSTLDELDDDDMTRRWNGGVLHITVTYSSARNGFGNFFGAGSISYVIGVDLLPQKEFKNMHSSEDLGGKRIVYDEHGFLVVASVTGTMYVFDFVYLTQVLTTSVGLFTLATIIVDFLMTNVLSHNRHYRMLQYQHTIEFDDFEAQDGIWKACLGKDEPRKGGYWTKIPNIEENASVHPLIRYIDKPGDLQGEDLLYVLLKLEQRLNSLDGLDVNFVCGASEKNVTSHPAGRFLADIENGRKSLQNPVFANAAE